MHQKVEPAFLLGVAAAVSCGFHTCSGSRVGCGILLPPDAKMLAPNRAHLIEQFWLARFARLLIMKNSCFLFIGIPS